MASTKDLALKELKTLDRQLEQLLGELSTMEESHLLQAPGEGKWSPVQVLQHLMLSENGSMQYVRKKTQSGYAGFEPSDWKGKLRSRLVGFYLSLPFKFKAPAVVDTPQFPEVKSFEEIREGYLQTRRNLADMLHALPEEAYNVLAYRHPLGGRMNLNGMLHFFAAHFERHEKQIRRSL
ncbi:MAG: DinB family protein [Haliscomenobacter sp.]|nr:DinB family protein [Haliscomenobacter sp.]